MHHPVSVCLSVYLCGHHSSVNHINSQLYCLHGHSSLSCVFVLVLFKLNMVRLGIQIRKSHSLFFLKKKEKKEKDFCHVI